MENGDDEIRMTIGGCFFPSHRDRESGAGFEAVKGSRSDVQEGLLSRKLWVFVNRNAP